VHSCQIDLKRRVRKLENGRWQRISGEGEKFRKTWRERHVAVAWQEADYDDRDDFCRKKQGRSGSWSERSVGCFMIPSFIAVSTNSNLFLVWRRRGDESTSRGEGGMSRALGIKWAQIGVVLWPSLSTTQLQDRYLRNFVWTLHHLKPPRPHAFQ
jgi:hypothetical protein